jgi:hypothetical protein
MGCGSFCRDLIFEIQSLADKKPFGLGETSGELSGRELWRNATIPLMDCRLDEFADSPRFSGIDDFIDAAPKHDPLWFGWPRRKSETHISVDPKIVQTNGGQSLEPNAWEFGHSPTVIP